MLLRLSIAWRSRKFLSIRLDVFLSVLQIRDDEGTVAVSQNDQHRQGLCRFESGGLVVISKVLRLLLAIP